MISVRAFLSQAVAGPEQVTLSCSAPAGVESIEANLTLSEDDAHSLAKYLIAAAPKPKRRAWWGGK